MTCRPPGRQNFQFSNLAATQIVEWFWRGEVGQKLKSESRQLKYTLQCLSLRQGTPSEPIALSVAHSNHMRRIVPHIRDFGRVAR